MGEHASPVFFVYLEGVDGLALSFVEWVFNGLLWTLNAQLSTLNPRLLVILWSPDGHFGPSALFGFGGPRQATGRTQSGEKMLMVKTRPLHEPLKMDKSTSISDLKKRVQKFCENRDWDQFHGAKDLAIGVITEAAELLERFRFLSDDQARRLLSTPSKRKEVEEELADILFFVLRFSQRFQIDLDKSLRKKLKKNAANYPIKKARGKNLKYTDL